MAMSQPNEPGTTPPKGLNIGDLLAKWLQNLYASYPKVRTSKETLNPTSIPANSEDTQTFTVTGLTTEDIVTVNKPTDTAGISISQVWVSAADTLSIKFRNHTGGAIDPGSESYLISAIRR